MSLCGDCLQYRSNCNNCPQLKADPLQLISTQFTDKKALWDCRKITVVTPSVWLGQCAEKSRLFRASPRRVIPYGIDTEVWSPDVQGDFRRRHQIDMQEKLLLFVAVNSKDRRKGLDELCQALQELSQGDPTLFEQVTFVKIGNGALLQQQWPAGLKILDLGVISEPTQLAQVYSAADLFMLPSLRITCRILCWNRWPVVHLWLGFLLVEWLILFGRRRPVLLHRTVPLRHLQQRSRRHCRRIYPVCNSNAARWPSRN